MGKQCPSVHKLGGMRCIRADGHDGLCWSRATIDRTGAMARGEWRSVNGRFVGHHQYATSYTRARVCPLPKGGPSK